MPPPPGGACEAVPRGTRRGFARNSAACVRFVCSFLVWIEVTKPVVMSPNLHSEREHPGSAALSWAGGGARPSAPGSSGTAVRPAAARRSRVARFWHQVRLGVCFVQFGATALFVAFVVAPILRRRSRGRDASELAVQRAIHRAFRFSVGFFKAARVLSVDARGLDEIARGGPCVLVANHPSLADVAILGSFLPQMDVIVNAGWTARSPFLARAIDAAGYVRNDGGRAIVDESADRLRRGRRLLVFPEGTRSPWGSFGRMHRGAAHVAIASGCPMVAVTIHCHPRMLGSGRKWHDVPERQSAYTIRVAGRFDPADYLKGAAGAPIAARRMTEDLLRLFLEEPNLADS
jgi:1-acyl-sn-glycerol-3-phosphate acyltransferase